MTTQEALRFTGHMLTALANRMEKDAHENPSLRSSLEVLTRTLDVARDKAFNAAGVDPSQAAAFTSLDDFWPYPQDLGNVLANVENS